MNTLKPPGVKFLHQTKLLFLFPLVSDCTMALKNNSKYVKAMERRARTLRKQAEKLKKKEDIDKEGLEDIVLKLKTSLEDCTGVCILEGFQKQEPMILVDAILKEVGEILNTYESKSLF